MKNSENLDDIGNFIGREEIFKDLFDNAHDLIHFAKPDGQLLYVNKAWSRSLKYTNEEIKDKSVYSFVHSEDKEKFLQYRSSLLNGSEVHGQITIRIITKSGETVYLEGNVSARFKEGSPLYTRGIFRNVTERVLHERHLETVNEQLRQEKENLLRLINDAPDAIIVINQNSLIRIWNPKAERLFGWKASEVVNTNLSDKIIPVEYREAHNKGMERYLATGEAHVINKTVEISAINKQKDEFYISLTISSCKIEGQTSFISFIRDITEEKKRQIELERKTNELERSNANLEEFAYAASHDLKEPIRKVQFFSDQLRRSLDQQLDEKHRRIFERMDVATDRMGLLVNDLLEYAHISLDSTKKETIDLNDKLRKVLQDLELSIEEKDAKVTVGEMPVVKGFRRQIQQLFQNLISNSLKYSKPGIPPRIIISWKSVRGRDTGLGLSKEDEDHSFHLIEVRDNGIGFNQEQSETIFKIFHRLHGKEEYSGTGVGLSIARKVVHNHGGHIWAEGILGEGASFKLILPE